MRSTPMALALRALLIAAALVVGPAALAPSSSDTTVKDARIAGGAATAASRYGWGAMQWDFAWEFGESLDSGPYRGADIAAGRWIEKTTGTGRAVKYGGGVEFHSALVRNGTNDPDFGDSTLTLVEQPAERGRWEIKERSFQYERAATDYDFVIELIPADPDDYDCGAHNLTIARLSPGHDRVEVGVNAGAVRWHRTFSGYRQQGTHYSFAVQVTGRRITWFVNGQALASLASPAAIPQRPMTLRLGLVGQGAEEMNKAVVKVDWVRHYDLRRGRVAPLGGSLSKGAYNGGC